MRPSQWFDAIQKCQQQGQHYVLVTLLASAGSTPRATGSKMVITADSVYDTIGGGHLEHEVTARARELLLEGEQQQVEHYPLASKLGQCCGGAINVLYEVFCQHSQSLAIFGAGHVAKALVPILAQLPMNIIWIDPRAEQFPTEPVANNVEIRVTEEPQAEVPQLPESCWMLIVTHNHQLDFDLVLAGLKRPDIGYLGMIGSDTKARRFQTRLQHRDIEPAQIQRLISPVGMAEVPGKRPVEVAVSIAGQIIQHLNNDGPQQPKAQAQRQQQQQQLKQLS